ncbi:carboxymuconolactone decarboxylase family protein [Oscillatoria laete-virens NRMC-F 0139]|nr:carboxymuconolactone decarboxylase family protein [Oscillatoria laete-virens]MDL5054507.1 carboxymuconolactone decarboxylase family protein [Oscillatoria laete-virens NRMC-F 0139]
MAKLPDPTQSANPKARKLLAALMKKRGRVDGMYRTLLNHPDLAESVSRLGTFLRFEGKLPGDIREAVILLSSQKLQVAYEWDHHVRHARDNGVPESLIEVIRRGKSLPPRSPLTPALRAAQFALAGKSIPAPLQKKLTAKIGVQGIVEIVVLTGFYTMIARIITAFDVALPPDMKNPFPR